MSVPARTSPFHSRRLVCLLHGALCILVGMMPAGCGSGSSTAARAGAISVASVNGAAGNINALAVSSTVKVSMTPGGDAANGGVDWTVTCGGNPNTGSVTNGACGTFSPLHTSDGAATLYTAPAVAPIGSAITITAAVTSNPSQSTTVSLTVVALPITVGFSLPNPTLSTNAQAVLSANLANDPTSAGLIWSASCGAAACGTFSPVVSSIVTPSGGVYSLNTTYTAPSIPPPGGTVTLTATSLADTSKSASVTVTIVPPPPPPPPPPAVSLNLSPAAFYVQTGRTAHPVATVTNDSSGAGIDWKLNCGSTSCGLLTGHTASGVPPSYVAPATVPVGGTVTITATSTADPTKSATSVATILTTAPIVVTLGATPAFPATLPAGSQAMLSATVASDSANLGLDWTATCGSPGACGSFNLSPAHTVSGGQIVYTAPPAVPASGVVTLTASSPSSMPSNPASVIATILAPLPSISFLQPPPAGMVSTATASVSAIIANDVAPGGVNWTVQCGSIVPGGCGWIAPPQTVNGGTAIYTAPPVTSNGTSVTIIATSVANPTISVQSAPIVISPATMLTTNFVPVPPSQVQAGATVSLKAAVANDLTNAGVDWQICDSGCGFFTVQPAVAAIPATPTTPYIPPVLAVTATHVSGWPNNRPLPYTAPTPVPASGSVVLLVASHANAAAANSAIVSITSTANGPVLHGTVMAGTQPVAGSTVSLYAAGTSGYASLASQLYAPGGSPTVTTDNRGSFTVPGGYSCPSPGSQMYLVATGGSVGANTANPSLALMTVLGSCGNLSSSSFVVNEVTSVASAYATAPFASNQALNGNSSYLYLGASSSNSTGLANAFATVNNLVDISSGRARYTVPAGNAAVPYVEINTLADMLNACAATSGGVEGDLSVCSKLFTATDVLPQHALYSSSAPADTLQAIFNIAEHPVPGYGYQLDANPPQLLGLTTSASPFQPVLTQQPNDWSLSLNYTAGGGLSAASSVGSFALDATGNLWITDVNSGTVIEWNSAGAALSPPTGFAAGGGPIAIDAAGDIWISGNGVLSELTSLGLPIPGSPFGGVAGSASDISIDGQNNVWIAAGNGVAEFNSLGQELSPAAGYTDSAVTVISGVATDSANNIWVGYFPGPGPETFAELTNPGGHVIVTTQGLGFQILPALAADAGGDMWSVSQGELCELPPYGGKGTAFLSTCRPGGGDANVYPGELKFANAGGIALDGAGIVWVASSGGTVSGTPNAPNVLPVNPGLPIDLSPSLVSNSLAAGTLRLAIDGSGNLWVLLANNTVTEYVGAATPVVTPIALGLKNRKLAARP